MKALLFLLIFGGLSNILIGMERQDDLENIKIKIINIIVNIALTLFFWALTMPMYKVPVDVPEIIKNDIMELNGMILISTIVVFNIIMLGSRKLGEKIPNNPIEF